MFCGLLLEPELPPTWKYHEAVLQTPYSHLGHSYRRRWITIPALAKRLADFRVDPIVLTRAFTGTDFGYDLALR